MPGEQGGIRPWQLILRCYVQRHPERAGEWFAHCIDLDLSASGRSREEARARLSDALHVYLETVTDTTDAASIPALLRRRAPLRFVARWHFLRLASALAKWLHRDAGPSSRPQPFELAPPFHLGSAHA